MQCGLTNVLPGGIISCQKYGQNVYSSLQEGVDRIHKLIYL